MNTHAENSSENTSKAAAHQLRAAGPEQKQGQPGSSAQAGEDRLRAATAQAAEPLSFRPTLQRQTVRPFAATLQLKQRSEKNFPENFAPAHQEKQAVTQGVFTVNGADAARPILERVDAYLQSQNRNDLVETFNDMAIDLGSEYGELSAWLEEQGLNSSIVGGQEEQSVFIKGIGEMILEIAKSTGIKDKNILEIITDLDVYGDFEKAKQQLEVREFKKNAPTIVKSGWVSWTSCFDTSKRLYALLQNVKAMGSGAGGGNADALSYAMIELCSQIQSICSEKIGAVFRVNIGQSDHSFTIIVQGDRAEIVQSFAGETGESLLMNVNGKHVYDAMELCGDLMNVCKPKAERKASSLKLFDGEIMLDKDHTTDLWPGLSLSWEMSSLKPAKIIFGLLEEKIKLNIKALQELKLL